MFWLLFACADDPVPVSTPTSATPATTAPIEPASSCDPLDPSVCALPWPSAYFQPVPVGQPGGRPTFDDDTLPADILGNHVRPDVLGFTDGYSTNTPLLVFLPDLDPAPLPDALHIADSLLPDAPILIVNTTTGERVPYFAELDAHAPPEERLLMIRPALPLDHGTRYVVGLRGLSTLSGQPVVPSEHFLALRDGLAADDPDLPWRQPRYDDHVFPALEAAGATRQELQLAWDFSTGTIDGLLGDMVHMRDVVLDQVGPSGPPYTIDLVEEADCTQPGVTIGRTVTGRVTVPRFTEEDEPPTRLARDGAGTPIVVGETDADFMFRVPCSLLADPGEGGMLLDYGHGLLGDLSEARTGHLSTLANDHRYVVFAMNWTGMATEDALAITGILLTGGSDFPAVPERSMQGFVNRVAGVRAARGALRDDPALMHDGKRLIGDDVGYYGISQGGIMGAAYLGISPDIERGVFGVNGGPYSLLLARSHDFAPFYDVLAGRFPDYRDSGLLIAVIQTAWDAAEGAGYARVLTTDPLPGTPPKQILAQVAVGDAQVTTLGAHHQARAWGAVTLEPAVRPIWGVDEVSGPVTGPVLVEWSYDDGPVEPVENLPPDAELDTHECPRREPEAQAQIARFFATGEVVQTCEGGCFSSRVGLCD